MYKLLLILIILGALSFNVIFSKVEHRDYLDVAYTEKSSGDYDILDDVNARKRSILVSDFKTVPEDCEFPIEIGNRIYRILDNVTEGEINEEDGTLKANTGIVATANGRFGNTSNSTSCIIYKVKHGGKQYVFTYYDVKWYCHEKVADVQASTVYVVGAGTDYEELRAGERLGWTTEKSKLIITREADPAPEEISLAQYYEDIAALSGRPPE